MGESMLRQAGRSHYFRNPSSRLLSALADCDQMQAVLVKNAQHAGRIFHLTYAQLVSDTAPLMEELCGFLGLPFEPATSGLKGSDQSYIGDRSKVPLGEEVAPSGT